MQTVPRSLSKDQNDTGVLWARARLEEAVRRNAEGYFPYFYNVDGMPVWLNGAWRGQAAFLLAGGPSARGLDLTALGRCWVMTLNNAHTTYRGNAACMVDDPQRFSASLWLDPAIMKFMPMSHFGKGLWDNRLLAEGAEQRQQWGPSKLKVADCPNVIGFRRNEKFHAPRYLHEETINWGNHKKYGGGRSVMVAAVRILYILGFRRVYLLGVDFEMTAEKRYHFAEDRTAGSVRGNMSTYAKLQKWFTELQPHFLKAGYVVKNCNAASRLTAFPFVTYEEAIAEATAHLGDYRQERTVGMYRKREEKLAEIGQAPGGAVAKEYGASEEGAKPTEPEAGNG